MCVNFRTSSLIIARMLFRYNASLAISVHNAGADKCNKDVQQMAPSTGYGEVLQSKATI